MEGYQKRCVGGLSAGLFALALASAHSARALDVQVFDSNGEALSHSVVTIQTAPAGKAVSGATVVIEQSGQQFKPRVTVISPGTSVRFPNRDLTQHHVYSFSQAKAFEIELYGGEEPSPVVMENAGIVAMGCNIHDWMLGYIYISPDPFFGLTNQQGLAQLEVEITQIQTVSIWHPGLATESPLTISEPSQWSDGTLEVTVSLPRGNPLQVVEDPLQGLFGPNSE